MRHKVRVIVIHVDPLSLHKEGRVTNRSGHLMVLVQDNYLGCHLLDSLLIACCVGICDCEGIRCFSVSAVALQW